MKQHEPGWQGQAIVARRMLRGQLTLGSAAVTHHRLRPAKIDEASRGQIQRLGYRGDAHGPTLR